MKNWLIRMKHRAGFHKWTEWTEDYFGNHMRMVRFCSVCRKEEICRF